MAQAQPSSGLSQEGTDQINTMATAHWNDWKENATAEQKATYKDRYQKMQGDVEFRNTTMAGLGEDWNGSDADGDGKLNLDEFLVYMGKAKAKETAAGCYVRPDPDNARTTTLYNIANTVSEGEGIIMMEFFTVMGPWMAKYLEVCSDLSPALLERVKAYSTEQYNDFAANATAEQQTAYWEFMAKMKDPTNSETRDTATAKHKAEWAAADANADGLLNLDEFRVYYEGMRKTRSEEGHYIPAQSQGDALYALMNDFTEGTDGVAWPDFYTFMTHYTQTWADLKGQ